jgi:DNA-directed RNA polymerase specialized sigma24 family protein
MSKIKQFKIPDAILIPIIQGRTPGDPETAFKNFYFKHAPGVLNLCKTHTNSLEEAENLLQKIFIKHFEFCMTVKERNNPSEFLYKIARKEINE